MFWTYIIDSLPLKHSVDEILFQKPYLMQYKMSKHKNVAHHIMFLSGLSAWMLLEKEYLMIYLFLKLEIKSLIQWIFFLGMTYL